MRLSLRPFAVAPLAAAALALTGCASPTTGGAASSGASSSAPSWPAASSPAASSAPHSGGMGGHGAHQHPTDGGPAPAGIRPAASPRFAVGSTVRLTADHMPGMQGSTATVVGAYDTTTYAVDYRPTTGGPEVKNHKWVVHEELAGVDAASAPLAEGTEVTLPAEHMPGMKGAKATIVSATREPVYMVDVVMDGTTMTNHKWVAESEMTATS